MTKEEKVENLISKGLNSEFIQNAEEEKLDLVMERLAIYEPHMNLKEKRTVLMNLIR